MLWLLFITSAAAQTCTQCSTCHLCSVYSLQFCPANSLTTSPYSTNLTDCQCIGGAFGPANGQPCDICVAGTYTSSTGSTNCTQCSAGTFSSAVGASSPSTCALCTAGSYNSGLGRTASCQLCGPGTFSAAQGAVDVSTCNQCAAGTYQTGSGAPASSSCLACGVGTWSSGLGLSAPTQCTSCSVGTFSVSLGATDPSTCLTCPVGQFCSTVGTAPAPCTNLPANAYYTTTGTNSTNCQWACNTTYWKSGAATCSSCPANSWCAAGVKNTCPTNSISQVLSGAQNQCLCAPGYSGDGSVTGTSPCVLCQAGSYCQGGNTNLSLLCPAFSTSPPGSQNIVQCQCLPGYMGANGTNCSKCQPNTICQSGMEVDCPANSNSPEGNSASCTCNAGYYSLTVGGICIECPANSYCEGGMHKQACVGRAVSPAGSINSTACYCDRGYVGVANAECQACPAGTWCWTGVLNNCPANTTSAPLSARATNCTCLAGYTGPDGGSCSACLPGNYKGVLGSAACTPCAANSFTLNWGSTACTPATICAPGNWANPVYTATTDNVCVICPANYQCQNNTATPCPASMVSEQGSDSYLDCRCKQGTFGQVTGPNDGTCSACPQGSFCPAVPCGC